MAWTIPLKRGGVADPAVVGGKGANLCRLADAGFPVPAGFCVTTAAYRHTLAPQVLGSEDGAGLRERILHATFPAEVQSAIATAYESLRAAGVRRVAVRSSSTAEDVSDGSFAGQAESFLDVRGLASLLAHIKRCWASLFREESLLYRLRGGSTEAPASMAVIVQEVVPADAAGVLFTANPLTGDRDELLLCSAFGLGEAVVGGRETDTYYIDKHSGAVRERHLGEKTEMVQSDSERGLVRLAVPADKVHADSLDPALVRELVDIACRIERHFGEPQDIEWAVQHGRVHVLQSRPITAGRGLGTAGGKGGGPTVWSNINVGEALPGVGTPMTWSILRAFSRRGFEHAFGALGLKVPEDAELVGSFRGRVYLNLTEFMSIASQIPFFPPDRLLELGGGGGLEKLQDCYEQRSPLRFMARLPLTLPRMALSQLGMPWVARRWTLSFRAYRDDFAEQDLGRQSPRALLRTLRRLTEVFNRTGAVMLACASNALSSYIAVLALLKRWVGDDAVEAKERLFVGLDSVRSAAPGLALLHIAHMLRGSPELAAALDAEPGDTPDPGRALARLGSQPGGAAVLAALDAFLAEHGRRAPREAELSTPRWREDPSFLLSVLRAHLRATKLPEPETLLANQADVRRRATEEIAGRMALPLRATFRRVLSLAQHAARVREQMRDHVVDTLAMYRRFLLEVGNRLVAAGLAADRDDVFFLTLDEVEQWLRAEAGLVPAAVGQARDLSLRIAARQAEHRAFCETPDPPDTFFLNAGEFVPAVLSEAVASGPTLRGLPGSPGRVSGIARVIQSPRDGERLQEGDILVSRYTDVGWTPLFLVAGGVVMDMGGPLSHSCVVAREYGLPAVVNTKNGTERIEDGQRITVDGDAGVVYLNGAADA